MVIGKTPQLIDGNKHYHVLSESVHLFFVTKDLTIPGFEISPGASVDLSAPFYLYSTNDDTEVLISEL